MINDLISHLQTELVVSGGYAAVEHSWSTEPLEVSEEQNTPLCLVFEMGETSDESNGDARVSQRTEREILIYTICAWSDLDALRQRLFDAALGFQATAIWDALQHKRGQTRQISGNLIWYIDSFTTWRLNEQT